MKPGDGWVYGVAAQDCTPALSSMVVSPSRSSFHDATDSPALVRRFHASHHDVPCRSVASLACAIAAAWRSCVTIMLTFAMGALAMGAIYVNSNGYLVGRMSEQREGAALRGRCGAAGRQEPVEQRSVRAARHGIRDARIRRGRVRRQRGGDPWRHVSTCTPAPPGRRRASSAASARSISDSDRAARRRGSSAGSSCSRRASRASRTGPTTKRTHRAAPSTSPTATCSGVPSGRTTSSRSTAPARRSTTT